VVSLEQVNLLEVRVAKAIEIVQRVTEENQSLASERAGLQAKLEANQKRIDELELLVMRFKEDQGRIEDGIIAALDRLSQFEEAFENSLKDDKGSAKKPAAKPKEKAAQTDEKSEVFFEIPEKQEAQSGAEDVSSGELDIF